MSPPDILIAIGLLFIAGLGLEAVGHRIQVPRVSLMILAGAIVGPPVLDLLPPGIAGTDDLFAPAALTMVAFLLGGTLSPQTLRAHGREIVVVSLTVVLVSTGAVSAGLWLAGVPLGLALLLGGLSAATDPAATRDVVVQMAADGATGARGRFAGNLLGIVAIDDAWGLLAFSAVLAVADVLGEGALGAALVDGLAEVGGAVALGLALGLPAAALTGRLKPGEPTLIEALGLVALCAGLALALGVSFLLAGMVCGAVVVNLARHHEQPFHEIERIEWPFMLLFFVMAGASLRLDALGGTGWLLAGYVGLRIAARILGGWLGGRLAGLPAAEGRLTGLALMPQAGVAIGMALVAAERFPAIAEQLLAVAIASTVIFEVGGPFLTQTALRRAGRAEAAATPAAPPAAATARASPLASPDDSPQNHERAAKRPRRPRNR